MRLQESYDLVVVGDQLSGLMLAAGAAQAGWRVLVIEGNPVPSVFYEVPSGRFLCDLMGEPVIGLGGDNKASNFLKEIGLQNIDELFLPHEPSLQIVDKKFRLDIGSEESVKKNRNEFDLPPDHLAKFMSVLSGKYVGKGTFSDIIRHLELPVNYELFGLLPFCLYGSMAPSTFNYSSYRDVIHLAKSGVRYPKGGRSSLKELLQSRIHVFGGVIKKSTWIEEIVFEHGKLTGVLLSSFEGFIRSPVVIGAMGAAAFLDLVPPELQSKNLRNDFDKIIPRFWRYTFSLTVPEAQIPEGMGTHVALIDREGYLEDPRVIQVNILDKDTFAGMPVGHKALVVRVMVPYTEEYIQTNFLERLQKRAILRLKKEMPFLTDYSVSPDPNGLDQDQIFQKFYKFKSLKYIPPSFLLYDSNISVDCDNRKFLDWSKFGLNGLGLCSRDIRPFIGLMGEIYTAMDLLGILKNARAENSR